MECPTSTGTAHGEGLLVLGADDPAPWTWAGPWGEVAVVSRRGPGKRTNEDGVLARPLGPDHFVLAVADGMGGLPDGERAARLTLEALAAALDAPGAANDPLGALVKGFEQANAAVLAGAEGAGATLVAALIGASSLQIVHAGDAEALVVGQRGRLKLRTVAHSPTGYALEAGLIDEREALVHEERHIVSNAIGFAPLTIEVGAPLALGARDTLVLASDGLFDNLTQREVVDAVRAGPLLAAAQRALGLATRRMAGDDADGAGGLPGKPDDLSVVLCRPAGGKLSPEARPATRPGAERGHPARAPRR